MFKRLFSIQVHSFIDIITNSSTEIFCSVKGKTEKQIQDILDKILKDFDCEGVEFIINQKFDDNDDEIEGVFNVCYDFEMHHAPCKMIVSKIEEVFKDIMYD